MLDVAIIGAGHNGLVAAAYLARAGLSVECFERRDIPGGACVTEELWPGIRASPGAYTLSLLRREIIQELDLHRHGLQVEVHEPYLLAAASSPGPTAPAPCGSWRRCGRRPTPTATRPSASAGSGPPRRRGR
jgi:phytoene dehydrogenase-like protein